MSDVITKLKSLDSLPNPPHVVIEILKFSKDPDASMQQASDVISTDPALATQVIKLANSSSFSRGREVTTLREAVTNLGTRRILIVALGFSIKDNFSEWQNEDGKPDVLLWQHSVATAVFAREIAKLVGCSQAEQAFLCGLLSRLGQLVFSTIISEQYTEVIRAARPKLPTADLEREILGTDFHEAGRALLEHWELPTNVSSVVGTWRTPKLPAERTTEADELAAIVNLANLASHLIFDDNKAEILQQLHCCSTSTLGITASSIERLVVASETAVQETLESFNKPLEEELDCNAILELSRQQLVALSLGMASDLSNAHQEAQKLHSENKRLEEVSSTDSLTGIPNRHALELEFDDLDRKRATGMLKYAVLMIDIDHFKSFNDTYGHAVGDSVLREVAQTLSGATRDTDIVARYGGEEFCILLTNVVIENVFNIADRFRQAIEKIEFTAGSESVRVTASFGVAASEYFPNNTSRELVGFADKSLYLAKDQGRNCVVFAEPERGAIGAQVATTSKPTDTHACV